MSSSPERNTAFYVSGAISLVGLLLFFTALVSAAMNFDNFDGPPGSSMMQAIGLRGFAGIMLIVAGGAIRAFSARK